MNETRDRILEINSQMKSLEEEKTRLTSELRATCKHERVVVLESSPPRRICVVCSIEEEGWGGYKALIRSEVLRTYPSYDAHLFYRYRELYPLTEIQVPVGLLT
jgi:hypothetical protein